MRESQQILEWQAEAKIETQRENLLRLLEKRCKSPVPSDLAEAIQATPNMDLLRRWFDVAVDITSFDEFRAAMLVGR